MILHAVEVLRNKCILIISPHHIKIVAFYSVIPLEYQSERVEALGLI